jgi:hypothetical protein
MLIEAPIERQFFCEAETERASKRAAVSRCYTTISQLDKRPCLSSPLQLSVDKRLVQDMFLSMPKI